MRLIVLIASLSLLAGPGLSQALPEQLIFEQLTIPGTIRSSEIVDVLQDPEGLIWVAADGLYQYDGVSFTHFTTLPDSGSISGREINFLFYDTFQKRLLIATRNHGIVEFNYSTNQLKRLPNRDGIPIVNHIAQTADGTIWGTSFNNGLFFVENDTLKQYTRQEFNTRNATSLFKFGNRMLVGDVRKIYILENRNVIDSINLKWGNVEFTVYSRVTAMEIDAHNNLYIGTEKQGVLIYDLNTKKFVQYFSPENSPFFNRINKIFKDNQGLIWILTKSGGLVVYSPEEKKFKTAKKNPLSASSISGDNCTSIIQDKTGIIWIGATGALNKFDPNKIKFLHITNDPLNTRSLSDKMVRGIFEDDNGNILVGTDGGYLNEINRKDFTVKRIKIEVEGVDRIIVPVYIQELDKNTLIIGTSVGVLTMDKKTSTFRYYEPLKNQLYNRMARQLIRHNENLYFISTGHLYIHNLKTKETQQFKNYTDEPGKQIANVTAMYLDSRDRLWLGVQGGISRMNKDYSFTYIPIEKDLTRSDGSYFMVLSLEEINDKLWIGTFNNGLWQLDLQEDNHPEKSVRQLNIPELSANTVYATLSDNDGNVWISTNQGILKYDLNAQTTTNFTISEGVQDLEFNRLAYLKTRSGDLVFGGINGINIFDPEKINSTLAKPIEPVILSISNYRDINNTLYVNVRNKKAIKLPAKETHFSIQFVVPGYHQPPAYTVEYMLENYDVTWNETIRNAISYSKLKPGTYTFKVRTRIKNEIAESEPIQITIVPPFWQTWWFITLAVCFLFIATYAGAQAYATKTKHDKERLERLLKERTAEIEKSREELEILNQKKDLIFSILSHDLRSPLTTLKGFLSIIIENVDALPKEAIKKHARSIRNSVSSSLDLIDNTLYWSMSQTGSISYTPANFSVTDALRKIYNLYQLTAEKKRIHFHFSVTENIEVYGDENMLYVALRNLVSNALKFTSEGKNVHISAYRNHQHAIIKIADEGIGMDNNYIEKLLADEQLSLKIGTANEKGTGLGLILCKKFVQLNQGELTIVSAENTGTEFTVSLPLAT